jgi:putative hydrolase of the HAD superfamily
MMSSSADRPTVVIFDGDDTLWSTEHLYDNARSLARQEVTDAGLDGAEWEGLERRLDVENVGRLGFSVERFPTSCVQAYDALCDMRGARPVGDVRDRIRDAARTVFASDPPLTSGARETLSLLRSRSIRLALLTKGDHAVQQTRIEKSGIADAFDFIQVVAEKTPATFRKIVFELSGVPERAWSVGNSVTSDIAPAVEAGLHAIWIDAYVWEHERFAGDITDSRVVKAQTLEDVPEIIERARSEKRDRRVSATI